METMLANAPSERLLPALIRTVVPVTDAPSVTVLATVLLASMVIVVPDSAPTVAILPELAVRLSVVPAVIAPAEMSELVAVRSKLVPELLMPTMEIGELELSLIDTPPAAVAVRVVAVVSAIVADPEPPWTVSVPVFRIPVDVTPVLPSKLSALFAVRLLLRLMAPALEVSESVPEPAPTTMAAAVLMSPPAVTESEEMLAGAVPMVSVCPPSVMVFLPPLTPSVTAFVPVVMAIAPVLLIVPAPPMVPVPEVAVNSVMPPSAVMVPGTVMLELALVVTENAPVERLLLLSWILPFCETVSDAPDVVAVN